MLRIFSQERGGECVCVCVGGGSSFFLDAGRGWDSVKVFPKQAPGPQVPFPTSLKPVERVENLSRVGCVCVASGRGRVEDEGCGLPPATARMLILAGVLMCWWKEIKLDQQNLSTETSCLPAPFSLQAAPTDQEGAGKWRGRHVLGIQGQRERGSKRMCISNIVTPQQPVFTFQSLIVLGNALHKPQVAWCTLLWRATQAPRPRAPTSCRLLEASNLVPDGSCRRLSAPTHANPKSLPTSLVLRKRCCVLSPLHPSLLFPAWLASWPGAQGTQEGARGEGRETELSRGSSTKESLSRWPENLPRSPSPGPHTLLLGVPQWYGPLWPPNPAAHPASPPPLPYLAG